jgi:hypothetical protein
MLHLVFAAAFSFQVAVDVKRVPGDSAKADSAKQKKNGVSLTIGVGGGSDSTRKKHRHPKLAVTPELLRTAFEDSRARDLLLRARSARLEQDTTLESYDATAYQRISAGLGFAKIGRDRLIFRTENVSRVQWQRGVGAWIELKGARTAIPIAPADANAEANKELQDEAGNDMSPIPYYPGRESLWIGSGLARADVSEDALINPLARGAEAYYTYASGDSVSFRLQDGHRIRLQELRARARTPKWNVAVGSLWFDQSNAQLVRAVYRMSEPIDVWAVAKEESDDPNDDVPALVRPLLNPMRASIDAISVEYGLYEGRFWLPRIQAAEGYAQVSFMHVPFKMEESFKYASVNGTSSLPAIAVKTRPLRLDRSGEEGNDDSLAVDTLARAARRDSIKTAQEMRRKARVEKDTAAIAWVQRDSAAREERRQARESKRKAECDSTGHFTKLTTRYEGTVAIAVQVPCDKAVLAHSPDLPKSIYDAGDEVFGANELKELVDEALTLTTQPGFSPQKPKLDWGLQYTRYNRVEGLSSALAADERLGSGYTARLLGHLGTADLWPNVELSMVRTNGRRSLGVSGYRRLAADNDWGNPFSFGAGLSSLLFARDEGFYYRTLGAEATYTRESGPFFSARLFTERQTEAPLETQFSLPHAFSGVKFIPNIAAAKATETGLAIRHHATRGLDPHGWRLLSDLHAEGGFGDFDYSLGSLDATVSHGLGKYLDGAVTAAGGTSGGRVPAQRLWYLGGTQTVRGQRAGLMAGDAFWLSHVELAGSYVAARPVVFGDLGWAGRRLDFWHPGRPLAGAGVGASFMDGLIRFDVSKGIHPGKEVRVDLYLEARF